MSSSAPPARGSAKPAVRFGVRIALAATALILVAVPFGLLLLLVKAHWRPLLSADNGATGDLHRYALEHHWFVTAMNTLSTIGSTSVWVAVFAAVASWLVWRRLTRLAVFAVVTVTTSALVNNVVKLAVNRSRPVLLDPVAHSAGLSFPSGHAQAAITGYAVLLLVFRPALRRPWPGVAAGAAVLMVVAIGFSRVALGVHYTSDVLAGYVLGGAWVAAMTAAFNVWRTEGGREPARSGGGLPHA